LSDTGCEVNCRMSQHLVDDEAVNSVVLILNLCCLKKGRSGWHTKLTNWYFSFKH